MTDDRNLSTEHQRKGDARRPSDTLDKDQVRPADEKDAKRGSGTLSESEVSTRERSGALDE